MSTVTYRHENSFSFKKGGVKHRVKESIIDGEKGLSFHYLNKAGENDKNFISITVRETEKNKFSVRVKRGDKTDDSEVDLTGLMKFIKGNKSLEFVDKFLSKERGQYGRRRRSRKGSKS